MDTEGCADGCTALDVTARRSLVLSSWFSAGDSDALALQLLLCHYELLSHPLPLRMLRAVGTISCGGGQGC